MRYSRTSLRRRFSEKATQRSSTTSGTQILKTLSKTAFTWRIRSKTMDENPDPKFKVCQHLKVYHDAICVVDMERAQEEHVKFLQTLTVASSASTRFPNNGVSHQHDKAETYTNTTVVA